jgi:hypothetical protein
MQFVKKRERSELLHQVEQSLQEEEIPKSCLSKAYWVGYDVRQMMDILNEHASGKMPHDQNDILNKFRPLKIDLEDLVKCLPSGIREKRKRAIEVMDEDVNDLGLALEKEDYKKARDIVERNLHWDVSLFLTHGL